MSNIKEQINEFLANLIEAKKQALVPLTELSDTLSKPKSDREQAQEFVKEVCQNEDIIGRYDAKELVQSVALAHNIHAYIGDYGNGEHLLIKDDGWSGTRGDWISSSESC